MTTITLNFNLQLKDFLEGMLNNLIHRVSKSVLRIVLYFFVVIFGIVAWTIFGFSPVWLLMILFPIWIVLLILLIGWICFVREPRYRESVRLSFGEDGILFKSKNIDSKIEWTLYKECFETRGQFLLYYGKVLYTLIPKRVFGDHEQMKEFEKLVQNKILKNV